jgi:acetylornithine deacetylase
MNLIEVTRKLVDIPSVTGEEQQAGLFLKSFLTDLGYRVELNELSPGRCNVIASFPAGAEIVLSTHMDTVPPHIPSSEDADFVYGRGACDAKGIIAAQIFAAEKLRAEGHNNVGLLFTVDEEAGSDGAQVANHHPAAAACRYLINGEPTDNKLAIGSKGSLRLRLKTRGRAAHSAYPEQGHSAIETLLDVLGDIRKIDWPNYDFFGDTTCNIGTIKGGVRPNVIPESAEAELQVRLTTASSEVQDVLAKAVSNRAEIEYLSSSEPMRMLEVAGVESCIVRFTTDIPHLSNWGKPLLLGPGSIFDAHTSHEKVAKAELSNAVDLYVGLVHELTSKQP